jgi:hypothetical protein
MPKTIDKSKYRKGTYLTGGLSSECRGYVVEPAAGPSQHIETKPETAADPLEEFRRQHSDSIRQLAARFEAVRAGLNAMKAKK